MATVADSQSSTPARRVPGEEGVWVLIFGDMMIFSLMFAVFLYYRSLDVAQFAESQTHQNQFIGALNTFFMLTSSWFVALAVQAARRNLGRVTPVLLLMAVVCGVAFGVDKVFEYGEKINAGISLNTNYFYMFYFVLTGIHLVHVLIGMVVLTALARACWSGVYEERTLRYLECGACFWHLVDLLWIVLFALLYLIR